MTWPRRVVVATSRGVTGTDKRLVFADATQPDGFSSPNTLPIFKGRIRYRDDVGVIREMAFFRQLEYGSYRFVPWGDPQLEYSDTNP